MATEPSSKLLRTAFRYFNHFMLAMWRLGLGSAVNVWPAVVGRIMVLVHVGRKTGIRRRTPLNFAAIEGDIYCIAALGEISDWHKNVLANRRVEVWLPDGWWSGVATDVSDSPSRLPLLREVLIASGFASYCAGIWPKSISDAELEQRTEHYRVLRIELTHALNREGGPGDLAWVWPIVALALLVLLLLC